MCDEESFCDIDFSDAVDFTDRDFCEECQRLIDDNADYFYRRGLNFRIPLCDNDCATMSIQDEGINCRVAFYTGFTYSCCDQPIAFYICVAPKHTQTKSART